MTDVLELEIERLRSALEKIVKISSSRMVSEIARAALAASTLSSQQGKSND